MVRIALIHFRITNWISVAAKLMPLASLTVSTYIQVPIILPLIQELNR